MYVYQIIQITYVIDKVKLVLKKLRRKLLVNSTLPLSSRWVQYCNFVLSSLKFLDEIAPKRDPLKLQQLPGGHSFCENYWFMDSKLVTCRPIEHIKKKVPLECALFWPVGKPIKSTQKMHEIRQIGRMWRTGWSFLRFTQGHAHDHVMHYYTIQDAISK